MKLLVTGASGLLGSAVTRAARRVGHEVQGYAGPGATERGLDLPPLDVTDADAVRRAVDSAAPDAVVHCAAYTRVDDAESEPERAMEVNAGGTRAVAEAAAEARALLLYPGTDYVFDGLSRTPYRPADATRPLNAYGRSKLAGEEAVREAGGRWLIVRTSWLYGAGGRNFVDSMVERGRTKDLLHVVDDQTGSPTWSGSLAPALVELVELVGLAEASSGAAKRARTLGDATGGAIGGPTGSPSGTGRTLHLADRGSATWFELAREALDVAGVQARVEPVTSEEYGAPARRPGYSVLDTSEAEELLARAMPDWRQSLRRYLGEASRVDEETEASEEVGTIQETEANELSEASE